MTNRHAIIEIITPVLGGRYPADAATRILAAPIGATIRHTNDATGTPWDNWSDDLKVVHRSWGVHPNLTDVELADVLASPAVEVTLTGDGRRADRSGWHNGDTDIDTWVPYEVWTAKGREAHGYIDATTRRIVQAG